MTKDTGKYVGTMPRTSKPNPPRIPPRTEPQERERDIWERRYHVAHQELGDMTEAMLRIEDTPHGDECPRSNRKNSIECNCHRRIARDALAKLGK